MLLTIVAALTIGFTGCTDEFAGDQTQGKPGYLTINVKTLKPNQTKATGTGALNDYEEIHDLNIFVFSGANKIIHKYYDDDPGSTYPDLTVNEGVVTDIDIPVSSLNITTDSVVVVANFGSKIPNTVLTYTDLENLDINTVQDFSARGLHMTGMAGIIAGTTTSYLSAVKVAPVEAKITVDWVLTEDVALYYDVTGVYVTNAVSNTKLPIIRRNVYTSPSWAAGNILPAGFINLTGTTPARTAASGLIEAGRDFNFYYTTDVTNANLKDEVPESFVSTGGISLPASYTKLIDLTADPITRSKLHYYIGENYSNNDAGITEGTGAMLSAITDNSPDHQNTLVVVRVTPLSTAPDYIKAMGHKYYTYEFSKASTYVDAGNLGVNGANLGSGTIATDGFSVRRKTNYNLKFNLSTMGSDQPFRRLKSLRVQVEADAWDTENVTY
ncbi:MAG: hypothetical protein WC984_09330 [Bacteroidales bacterium]